jgi:dCTP deaminase
MFNTSNPGVLSDAQILTLVREGVITGPVLAPGQIQPASLDLRLGDKAYRLRASFLPGDNTVAKAIEDVVQESFNLDDCGGMIIPPGSVFLIPLQESLQLPIGISARANPKSSTGRLDIFVRVICDGGNAYEEIPAGYNGPLWLEIAPITFPIRLRKGSRLTQIRFRKESQILSDSDLNHALETDTLRVHGPARMRNGLCLGLNLISDTQAPIGWRARRHTDVIDIDRPNAYDASDFFEPVYARAGGSIILDPGEFYILASSERFEISSHLAAEMVPVDTALGEYRGHAAGFADPFFGWNCQSRLVFELRTRDVPFQVRHNQPIARLEFERMSEEPGSAYGVDRVSNYQGQGLKLAKHFRTSSYPA